MILQALNRYYEILACDEESGIAPMLYSRTGVSFALNISQQGDLLDIFPLFHQVQVGNKIIEKPRSMIVPEQLKRSGIAPAPNFMCDNAAFILGISQKEDDNPGYGAKRFETFRKFHIEMLANANCDAARAILAFLNTYSPASGRQHPEIAPKLAELTIGGNLAFMLNGSFAHDDPTIKLVWERYNAAKDAIYGQCLVTGEYAPISRLHHSLKGIKDATPTGASLVGFNDRAYESFNKVKLQGLNAPVSEKAAFSYTTALNYLLSSDNPNRKITIGDTTIVYWAESQNRGFPETFSGIFEPKIVDEPSPDNQEGRKILENELKNVAEKVRRTQSLDLESMLKNLPEENPRFYVLGLAPNAARVSVRFFLADPFQKIVERMMKHYDDMKIVKEYDNQPEYITVRAILDETVSKKLRDKEPSPLLAGSILRSILTGAPYPSALLYAIINRIRADMDDDQKHIRKINYVRAAIIKAFLIRKYHNQDQYKEVLVMSLNEQATIPAYLLGRLFAVLEKVQQEALGEMNASIKDRYFTSACASPAHVFPVLLRLSQHHIAKAEYGYVSDRRIQDILGLLDVSQNPIPARLTLDEQGIFILGYYHQRAAFYTRNNSSTAVILPATN
jgi:CRISPR-associated protein Csd1